ncbi:MAG: FAD-linked oxidase C-terminal domain-containing protein [Rubrivivax sp.]
MRLALAISRSQPELALMRRIKVALDPHDRLNPAKVLP